MLGIVLGTGPSLTQSKPDIERLQSQGALVFGVNNTYRDFRLNVWIACDPKWHEHYGKVEGPFDKWHWSEEICSRFGYHYVEGIWHDGLWLKDKTKISLNHCSGAQALNIAAHYGCNPILLVGHDFKYEEGKPRHYFNDLSDKAGEYPQALRKYSLFDKKGQGDDLLAVYKRISETPGIPRIVNCTPNSALPWFEMGDLSDF